LREVALSILLPSSSPSLERALPQRPWIARTALIRPSFAEKRAEVSFRPTGDHEASRYFCKEYLGGDGDVVLLAVGLSSGGDIFGGLRADPPRAAETEKFAAKWSLDTVAAASSATLKLCGNGCLDWCKNRLNTS